MPIPAPLIDTLIDIEKRLEFLLNAATADEINPAYSENLQRCHDIAIRAIGSASA